MSWQRHLHSRVFTAVRQNKESSSIIHLGMCHWRISRGRERTENYRGLYLILLRVVNDHAYQYPQSVLTHYRSFKFNERLSVTPMQLGPVVLGLYPSFLISVVDADYLSKLIHEFLCISFDLLLLQQNR
jgi:hypothetical protein